MKNFGEFLKQKRQEKKLTQKELAEVLKFSVGTVNKLCNELEEKGFIEDAISATKIV